MGLGVSLLVFMIARVGYSCSGPGLECVVHYLLAIVGGFFGGFALGWILSAILKLNLPALVAFLGISLGALVAEIFELDAPERLGPTLVVVVGAFTGGAILCWRRSPRALRVAVAAIAAMGILFGFVIEL